MREGLLEPPGRRQASANSLGAPALVERAVREPAQTLHPRARGELGRLLGHDFASVRIHTGGAAAASADALGARAYSIGNDVVFAPGEYRPDTRAGLVLLGHELAHVAQQRQAPGARGAPGEDAAADEREADSAARALEVGTAGPPVARRSQRRLRRQAVQMASGRFVGDHIGAVNNRREEVLTAIDRLHALWAMPNADYAAEYPVVGALPAGAAVPVGSIPLTIAAIARNGTGNMSPPVADLFLDLTFSAGVGTGQPNNKSDVLALQDALHVGWFLTSAQYGTDRARVNAVATATVPESQMPLTIAGLGRLRTAILAGTYRRDLYAGTHAVTAAQRTSVQHILQPGSTVSGGVVVNPPMTGAGAGGAFEIDMLAALKRDVTSRAARFNALRAAGPPTFPVASVHPIARRAQQEVERYFAPYIRGASRGAVAPYHPGTYSLISALGDESALRSADIDRNWWTHYWMTLDRLGQPVMDAHHVLEPRDRAEVERVRDLFVTAYSPEIEAAVRGWPAVTYTFPAGNVVDVQPYQSFANPTQRRLLGWDLYTTLIHEMLHVVTHPNFSQTATLIGGVDEKYLEEGVTEVMRHELWDGEGALVQRLGATEMDPVRADVEGAAFLFDSAVVVPHPYYGEYAQARAIDAQVGRANTKAAYFLGHTELLGLGQGTATASPLAGVAQYRLVDPAQQDVYVTVAGDTYSSILAKTNATAGGILGPGGVPLASGAAIVAGTRLRVPGIRWVYAIANDTWGGVASQNRVTLAELLEANAMAAGTAPTRTIAVGTRILIPIHRVPL
jgi:hypothetical protein